MSNQQLINNLLSEMEEINGKELIFNTPCIVKKTPHQHLFTAFGISYNDRRVEVMDEYGNWHEMLPDQANVEYVLQSLLQRIKNFKHNLLKPA